MFCFAWCIDLHVYEEEGVNERYRNTLKDLLSPNTVSQKDKKKHIAGLDDAAIPHVKI